MKRFLAAACLALPLLSLPTLASAFPFFPSEQQAYDVLDSSGYALNANVTPPVQRIDVVNMLWNPNSTGGAAGLTPTSVVVAFDNGGAKPCYSTTLAFEGAATVLAGTGLPCATAIASVSVTPVAGPAGAVYAAPTAYATDPNFYASQLVLTNATSPVFE
jgi:hypothetical protein